MDFSSISFQTINVSIIELIRENSNIIVSKKKKKTDLKIVFKDYIMTCHNLFLCLIDYVLNYNAKIC